MLPTEYRTDEPTKPEVSEAIQTMTRDVKNLNGASDEMRRRLRHEIARRQGEIEQINRLLGHVPIDPSEPVDREAL